MKMNNFCKSLENIISKLLIASSLTVLNFGFYTYSMLTIYNKTPNPAKIYNIEKEWIKEQRENEARIKRDTTDIYNIAYR